MLKFTMKRLVYLVLVLVGVSFLVFLLLYMTPGDPVRMMLGAISIIENAGLMGLPIPAALTKAVDILKQRSETEQKG